MSYLDSTKLLLICMGLALDLMPKSHLNLRQLRLDTHCLSHNSQCRKRVSHSTCISRFPHCRASVLPYQLPVALTFDGILHCSKLCLATALRGIAHCPHACHLLLTSPGHCCSSLLLLCQFCSQEQQCWCFSVLKMVCVCTLFKRIQQAC